MKIFCLIMILSVLSVLSFTSCGIKDGGASSGTEQGFSGQEEAYTESCTVNAEETALLIENEAETLPETTAETPTLPPETEAAPPKPRGYRAPEGWYPLRYETGTVTGGGYRLTDGVMGLKVVEVQKALDEYPSGYYRQATVDRVFFFQSQNGIEATGSVDLETWLALGLYEKDWFNLGTYVTPVAITESSGREEIIEVFLNTARSYIDTPYIVGASGKPGQGVDCSGLVLQCMYAVGVYPDGIDPVQHSTIEEYNSRLMWADPKLKEVSYGELMPGDLVFYTRPWSSSVCHVAVYIGNARCIEALYAYVEELPLHKSGYSIKGYKRVISE